MAMREAVGPQPTAALGRKRSFAVGVHGVDHAPGLMDGDRGAAAEVGRDEVQRLVGPAELFGELPRGALHVQGVRQTLARQFFQAADARELDKLIRGDGIDDERGDRGPAAKIVGENAAELGDVFDEVLAAGVGKHGLVDAVDPAGNGPQRPAGAATASAWSIDRPISRKKLRMCASRKPI